MQFALDLSIQKNRFICFASLSAYAVFAVVAFSDYFISDSNVFIALVLSPFIVIFDKSKRSNRYLIPSIIFIVISFFLGVRSILFLGFIFSLLLVINSVIGKSSWTLAWLLFFISPVFKFIALTFGFPIRLFLSKVSAQILSFAGSDSVAAGNIIHYNGNDFSVDPACVGLSMITISFILMLFIVSHLERKTGKTLATLNCISLLAITFSLNIICNLIRIIILVKFDIIPESVFHDITGIICLLVYVIIPVYWIAFLFYKKSKGVKEEKVKSDLTKQSKIIPILLLICLVISYAFIDKSIPATTPDRECEIDGFVKERLSTGVISFKNEHGLIYVKPMNFYNAEHNPLLCWKGSGYKFKNYETEKISGIDVYSGTIIKGDEKIYSAWWFDNGNKKTICQFEWRMDALCGSKYSLVNVNATTKNELQKLASGLLKQNIFRTQK